VWKFLEIASYVAAPLAYGLLIEFLFQWVRGRRGAGGEGQTERLE